MVRRMLHLFGMRWAGVADDAFSASKSEALRNAPMKPCGAGTTATEATGGGIGPLVIEGDGSGRMVRDRGPLH